MTETNDFKVEPWKPGELRFKIWRTSLIFTHAQARAIGKALLAEAGEESVKSCRGCFHFTSNAYGVNFCSHIESNVYRIEKPDSFFCSEYCEPAPDSRNNAEGDKK